MSEYFYKPSLLSYAITEW